ncbi:GNAT family N-acetyltransferase [Arthrobacter pigmenti]
MANIDPQYGNVRLRRFEDRDAAMAADLSRDPYVPLIGTLPSASDALRALTAFAWTIPVLHRVELYIEPWNTASIRTAERAGYEHEGLLRSHQEIAGKRSDMLLYAMVRETRNGEEEHRPRKFRRR